MLSVGETLVYGSSGVCRVDDICVRECGNSKREYYVLQPVYDDRSTVYVPTDSEKLISHVKPLLSREEVEEMIASMPEEGFEWIANDKERAETFRVLLEEGTRNDLVKLLRTLYLHKSELAERGKKLRSSDEAIMQRAQRLLYGELAWVLGIKPSEVSDFISQHTNCFSH